MESGPAVEMKVAQDGGRLEKRGGCEVDFIRDALFPPASSDEDCVPSCSIRRIWLDLEKDRVPTFLRILGGELVRELIVVPHGTRIV